MTCDETAGEVAFGDFEPYEDDAAALLDELRRLDRLLEHRLETWWADADTSLDEFSGLYISDEEVGSLLRSSLETERDADPAPHEGHDDRPVGGDVPSTPDSVGRVDDRADGTEERTGRTDGRRAAAERLAEATRRVRRRHELTREAGRTLRLDRLVETFGLTDADREVVLAALAPELDPKYGRIYAYLHDDLTRTTLTAGLVLRIFGADARDRVKRRGSFDPDAPLRANRILSVETPPDASIPAATIRLEERIVAFLLGDDTLPPELAALGAGVSPSTDLTDVPVDDRGRRRLTRLAKRVSSSTDTDASPPFVHLRGPYGSGRGAGAAAVCTAAGLLLFSVDLGRLAAADVPEITALLVREARLRRAAVAVEVDVEPAETDESQPTDAGDHDAVRGLVEHLDDFEGPVFLVTEEPLPPTTFLGVENHRVSTLRVPRPGFERRRQFWEAVEDLPADVNPGKVATTFRFTLGEIEDAMTIARRSTEDGELTAAAVYRGCRARARRSLGTLARRIRPTYTWEDIVLPADRLEQLREVAARITHRGQVFADWGFEDKYSLGNGLTVLFTGPSGTGKTMATEILANDAGLDLYKVDLASVVSKYIGETEKNLREIFDEAEGSDAILLFDEADALFGKRSDVSDARDRYANIEVNYLLQRIEEYDGIVVLTTNLKGNIDEAFERRVHVSVEFPMPDEASRAEMWRHVFPDRTPTDDLDVDFLSTLELTGGNIKNVALNAAFYAAAEDTAVGMPHVIRATRREYQKIGRLFNADDFGEYRQYLTG